MTQMATVQALVQVWVRQMGQDQYKDGGVGFDAEAATSLMEYAQRIEETGAGPDASTSVEDAAQSLDQSLFATDRIGITVAWSNQVVAHDADRKSKRLNSSHVAISYAVFCLNNKN